MRPAHDDHEGDNIGEHARRQPAAHAEANVGEREDNDADREGQHGEFRAAAARGDRLVRGRTGQGGRGSRHAAHAVFPGDGDGDADVVGVGDGETAFAGSAEAAMPNAVKEAHSLPGTAGGGPGFGGIWTVALGCAFL
jgi:hypothetical protein